MRKSLSMRGIEVQHPKQMVREVGEEAIRIKNRARLRNRYSGASPCCCPPSSLSSFPRFPSPQLNFLSVPAGDKEAGLIFLFDTSPVKCCLSLVPRAHLMSLFISQDRTWCQARAEFGTQHVLVQLCSRPPIIAGSARTAACCSGGLDGHADEPFQAINRRFYATCACVYAGFGRLRRLCTFTQILDVYAVITQ